VGGAVIDIYRPRVYGAAGASGVLGRAGQFFTLNGEPWTAIDASEFSLYARYLRDEDITPVLRERQAIRFGMLRVWLLNTSVIAGGLLPSQWSYFYPRLGPFVDLLGSYGFIAHLTAFTQTQTLMPSVSDQVDHWTRTQAAVAGRGNVLLSLVNEADQHDNRTDASLLYMRPSGVLASSGSNGADSPPPQPVWDAIEYHSNGLSEWQRKVGHNTMEFADQNHCPGHASENTRYPDQDASETHAYDAAAGAALLCGGACYHSAAGKDSRLFDDVERRCAEAWVAGARSVPLEFQRGTYHHRTDLEGGDIIRAYDRQLPDGRAHVVRIRA
jgi:hypothetical protein